MSKKNGLRTGAAISLALSVVGGALAVAPTASAQQTGAVDALTDEEIVEKRRGLGLFVKSGAHDALLQVERRRFTDEQWPAIHATIRRLGLSPQDLLSVKPATGR